MTEEQIVAHSEIDMVMHCDNQELVLPKLAEFGYSHEHLWNLTLWKMLSSRKKNLYFIWILQLCAVTGFGTSSLSIPFFVQQLVVTDPVLEKMKARRRFLSDINFLDLWDF